MQKWLSSWLLCCATSCATVCSTLWLTLYAVPAFAADAAPVLRLSANHWEPYTGASLPQHGIAADIVATALSRAGYAADIRVMPWSRALATTYSGDADGVVAIWSTNARQSRILYSDSYLSNELFLLYTRPDLGDRTTLDSLSGFRIGVGRDYDYSDRFLRRNTFKLEPVDRVVQNLLKLSIGRIDMVLEDKRIVAYALRTHREELRNLAPLRYSSAPLFTLPLYFGMNRDHPHAQEIIAAFNVQLKAMRRDGTLARILRRFDDDSRALQQFPLPMQP